MNCVNHLNREAIGVCISCGRPICEECRVEVRERNYCKKCISENLLKDSLKDTVAKKKRTKLALLGVTGIVLVCSILGLAWWYINKSIPEKKLSQIAKLESDSKYLDAVKGYKNFLDKYPHTKKIGHIQQKVVDNTYQFVLESWGVKGEMGKEMTEMLLSQISSEVPVPKKLIKNVFILYVMAMVNPGIITWESETELVERLDNEKLVPLVFQNLDALERNAGKAKEDAILLNRKAKEGATKGNLGALRSALAVHYGDKEGYYPRKLEEVVPIYLEEVPCVKLGIDKHRETNEIVNVVSSSFDKGKLKDTGKWFYWCNSERTQARVFIDCTCLDSKGQRIYEW